MTERRRTDVAEAQAEADSRAATAAKATSAASAARSRNLGLLTAESAIAAALAQTDVVPRGWRAEAVETSNGDVALRVTRPADDYRTERTISIAVARYTPSAAAYDHLVRLVWSTLANRLRADAAHSAHGEAQGGRDAADDAVAGAGARGHAGAQETPYEPSTALGASSED